MEVKSKSLFNKNRRKKGGEIMRKVLLISSIIAISALMFAPMALAKGTPAGTEIKNKAYADYKDANGNDKSRVYSNEVTTVVSQVAAINITPDTGNQSGVAGSEVAYPVTICNDGNGDDTFTLSVADTTWTSKIYFDTNGDGVWDPLTETTEVTSTTLLAADVCYKVIVVTTIPPTAADGAESTATLTATSTFDNTVKETGTYKTTSLKAVFSIVKSVVDTPANPVPGDIITYRVNGENTGSADAEDVRAEDTIPTGTTYVAGSMRYGPVTDTYSTATTLTDANDGTEQDGIGGYFDGTKVIYTRETFPAGEKGSFFFQVKVNDTITEGTNITNTLTAYHKHIDLPTEYTTTSNTTTTTVGSKPAIEVKDNGIYSGDPGTQIVHAFTATNKGNAPDTINITYSSGLGWTWKFWVDVDGNGEPGTDGDYELTDTNSDGIIDTGVLAANGGSINILAVATIPVGTTDANVDTTTVTGTSVKNNTLTDAITITTTCKAPVLSLSKTVSPEGTQPPGTELTYTVTATNTGSGNATSIIIFDVVPQYTTYVADSIKTGGTVATLATRTDASDGDGGSYDSNSKTVTAGTGVNITLGQSATWVLQFKVTID